MPVDSMFKPFKLGNLTLPNRIVMTAVKLGYATEDGKVTDRHIAFYVRRAEGGAGLITSEPLYVQRNGRELPTQLGIHTDDLVPGLSRMVESVHTAGGLMMAHINHAGRAANPKLIPSDELVSASAVLCPANQVIPRPLTGDEIAEIVVGGGPAGLEAASIAAQRGHQVSLYEQEDWLGGQFHLASRAPYKEEFLDVIRYLSLMVDRAGVDIHLGVQITPQMLIDMHPEAVIIATGGIPLSIPFPGLDQARWILASDLLEGVGSVETPTVLVIGGGLVGLEVADLLASQGRQVAVIEMLPDVGADMDLLAKSMLLGRLRKHNVTFYTNTRVTRFSSNAVFAQQDNQEIRFPIETVIIAVGVRPNRELADSLESSGLEMYVVGDAVQPRKVLEAIWEGFETGLKV
jgi:thioredoxin reductase